MASAALLGGLVTKLISVQSPQIKKINNTYMAGVSMMQQAYIPQPRSTTRSLIILTHHRSGLWICLNLVKRAAEKHDNILAHLLGRQVSRTYTSCLQRYLLRPLRPLPNAYCCVPMYKVQPVKCTLVTIS